MILHPRELLLRFDTRRGINQHRGQPAAVTIPTVTPQPPSSIGPEKIRKAESVIAGGAHTDDAMLNDLVEAILSSLDAEL